MFKIFGGPTFFFFIYHYSMHTASWLSNIREVVWQYINLNTLHLLFSFPIFLSRSPSFYLFLFCLFSCPLSLTPPVGTEYGNAIRATESPSVCGKLNTLSNTPWGLGLQNWEGGHGRSGARQNAREQPKMPESVGSSLSWGIGSVSVYFHWVDTEGVKTVYVLILSL